MQEAEVRALAETVLDIDRLIYEQQLGLAWERPPMPPMLPFSSSPNPTMVHVAVGPSSGMAAAAASMTVYDEAYCDPPSSRSECSTGDVAEKGERAKVSAETLKKLMRLLCDEGVSLVLYSSCYLHECYSYG